MSVCNTESWKWDYSVSSPEPYLQACIALHVICIYLCLSLSLSLSRFDMVARGVNIEDLNASAALDLSKLGSLRPQVATPLPRNLTSSPLRPSSQLQLDSSNWNHTLSELRHSIRQVKEELAAGNQKGQHGRGHKTSRGDKGQSSNSDDDLDISERSVLSRSDLSPRTSRSTMVNSWGRLHPVIKLVISNPWLSTKSPRLKYLPSCSP